MLYCGDVNIQDGGVCLVHVSNMFSLQGNLLTVGEFDLASKFT